jgi:hypothetical protein
MSDSVSNVAERLGAPLPSWLQPRSLIIAPSLSTTAEISALVDVLGNPSWALLHSLEVYCEHHIDYSPFGRLTALTNLRVETSCYERSSVSLHWVHPLLALQTFLYPGTRSADLGCLSPTLTSLALRCFADGARAKFGWQPCINWIDKLQHLSQLTDLDLDNVSFNGLQLTSLDRCLPHLQILQCGELTRSVVTTTTSTTSIVTTAAATITDDTNTIANANTNVPVDTVVPLDNTTQKVLTIFGLLRLFFFDFGRKTFIRLRFSSLLRCHISIFRW